MIDLKILLMGLKILQIGLKILLVVLLPAANAAPVPHKADTTLVEEINRSFAYSLAHDYAVRALDHCAMAAHGAAASADAATPPQLTSAEVRSAYVEAMRAASSFADVRAALETLRAADIDCSASHADRAYQHLACEAFRYFGRTPHACLAAEPATTINPSS